MVESWNFLSFWGISIYIRVGRPTQGRRRQTHERDGILPIGRHGVVDTKFDCTGLAGASGPEFGRLRKPIGLLETPPLNGRDGRPRGRAPFKSCVIERNQRSHDLAARSRRFRAQRPRALDLARTSRPFIWMATSVNSDRPLPLVTSEIRWRASCALGALC